MFLPILKRRYFLFRIFNFQCGPISKHVISFKVFTIKPINMGNVQNAEKHYVKKNAKRKSQNVKLQNVEINVKILTFCPYLYSKKTSNHKMPNYKMSKQR